MITSAFEDLSQALRVLAERVIEAPGTMRLDPYEAIGDLESALSGVLNAFHSVHDVLSKETDIHLYRFPETLFILALRNARHHNHSSKIRTLYRYHLDITKRPSIQKDYLIIDFNLKEEGASSLFLPISWFDFNHYLNTSSKITRLNENYIKMIWEYLDLDSFDADESLTDTRVEKTFFNIFPLLRNAGIRLVSLLGDRIETLSTEAKTFFFVFSGAEFEDISDRRFYNSSVSF